jgi:diguanylate cyclase (GGDEF)-like protein
MQRKTVVTIMVLLQISLVAYIVSNLLGNQFFSNIFSPLATLSSSIIILLTIKPQSFFKISWLLLALMAFLWGIADTIWMVIYNFLGSDPQESVFLLYFYMLPSLLILVSCFVYFKRNLKKWHDFQLTVDSVITFIIIFVTLWFSLSDFYVWDNFTIHENISNIGTLVIDGFSLLLLVVMIISARVNKLSKTMMWLIAGLSTYIYTDFYYGFSIILDFYQPNTLIDTLYILSITFFGTAAYLDWKRPGLIQNPDLKMTPQNFGGNKRLIYFICIPVILSLIGILNIKALFIIAFFIIFYFVISGKIQTAIHTEALLTTEKVINERLEDLVSKRTIDLKASKEEFEQLAIHDTLSSLYNRRYFLDKLDTLIQTDNTHFSLYYLDLDHFKIINDIHGHEMGDEVLRIIAKRFIDWQCDKKIVARVGDDEFAVIHIHDAIDDKQINHEVCAQILGLFANYITVGDYLFNVGASIGISRYPYDATDKYTLVKHADLAMYQAKKSGDEVKYVFYSREHSQHVKRKSKIELLLKTIDYDNEFTLHYQPQFSIDGKILLGVEALLRWQNPVLGNVTPTEFIHIAEETGSIIKIGKWVIDSAFKQIKQWHLMGYRTLQIGINLSPLQFDSIDFFPYIIEKINTYQIDPAWIDFEITESNAMNSGTISEEIFTALANLGVQISIDDFGTGYSSLSYLKRFDIDRLKIAKELIDHIVDDHEERLIIKAIILMAKGLGLATIAEGVETKEQLNILQQLECNAIQGYYFSKPLTREVFEATYSVD